MKRSIIIGGLITVFLAIFMFFAFRQVTPQEIENAPDWVPIEEASQKAVNDNRLILVDIYEVGCRFCRAMDREVYPSPSVRAVLDREYYPVKINGNSETTIQFQGEEITQKEFAAAMGATAFPFTVVIDADGNIIDRRRGYMDVVGLTRFLRDATESAL
ncbi:MAG: thioredoxin fold domain-containing protein [Balneolaceae bacterium]